jgi:hypothetical protein
LIVFNVITIMKIASIFLLSALKLFKYGGTRIYGTQLTGCLIHQDYNIHALIFTFLQNFSSMQYELMATIMWSLWKSRNMKLWQQQNETNVQVFQRATHLLEEWRAAHDIRSRSSNQTTIPQVRPIRQEEDHWKKLAPGRYKCNIDASFSTSLNRVASGMCLRDDDGAFVLARTEWFAPLCDIDVGEAVGLHTVWIGSLINSLIMSILSLIVKELLIVSILA